MYTVKLKTGTTYQATYVDESYRQGVYSLTMNLNDDEKLNLDDYAREFTEGSDTIVIIDEATEKESTLYGFGNPLVSRNFSEDVILVRVTKE